MENSKRISTLSISIVTFLFSYIDYSSTFLEKLNTESLSCQSNFSSATLIDNFNLECYIELLYISGGTAQCHNFTYNSLIVESSPSVLNTSFKCVSNKPIFSNIEFNYGVPVKHFMKLKWQRLLTDYNNPLNYAYQISVFVPSIAISSIGRTSVKYKFFPIEYPNENIQVLWHFSDEEENNSYMPTVSWMGDITYPTTPELSFQSLHTQLHANQELVTIPCVSPNWQNLILRCSPAHECSYSGIQLDNITLYYDPFVGFLLNTTRQTQRGIYYCDDISTEGSYNYIGQSFILSRHTNYTASSEISYIGTPSERIKPPFVHTPYFPDPRWSVVFESYGRTRFNLECSSTRFNVTIVGQDLFGQEISLNVTNLERERPVKTSIAKCTIPANRGDMEVDWYFHDFQCMDILLQKSLYRWQFHNLYSSDFQLSFDDTSQTLQCLSASSTPVEMRHVECQNIFMCQAMAKCLYTTDYGTDLINCRKGFAVATECESSGNATYSGVAPPCVSVKPFLKGLAFCIMPIMYNALIQYTYFLGFDNKLYFGDVHPPLQAIIKITAEVKGTDPLWPMPSHFLLQCEAHSFYFEEGIRWFLIYGDGSSIAVPNENLSEVVMLYSENPTSKVKMYLNDSSIVGIKCSAPILSIRDETSSQKWKNMTLKIKSKDVIAPQILSNNDNVKEIEIGDVNQGPKCQVEGFPKPAIQWFTNGKLLTNTKEDFTKRSSGEYLVENFLLIPIYSESDAGEYICVATNTGNSVEDKFTVRTRESTKDNDGSTMLIAVLITAVFAAFFATLFIAYRIKFQRELASVRNEKMKEIKEILKGKNNLFADSNFPNSRSINPLNFPFDKKYELKRSDFFIDLTKIIGTGEFGTVFQGKIKNVLNDVAFKTMNSSNDLFQLKSLTSELKILMYIGQHENVVQILGAYIQEIEKGTLYVATELCGLGSLYSYLRTNKGRFLGCPVLNPEIKRHRNIASGYVCAGEAIFSRNHSIKTLLKWSAEIANGMAYLGSKNVVHSDLATRNVLLTVDFVAKITDFGLSRKLYSSREYMKKGRDDPLPWRWLAIDSLESMTFSVESDVWAYGITLWEIFSFGDVPYPGIDSPANLKLQLIEYHLRNPKPIFASFELYEVMMKCWDLDPGERPSFRDLKILFENAMLNNDYVVDTKAFQLSSKLHFSLNGYSL